jgi:hypothetical protein
MYFPWNWEFGSAFSKLRGGGEWFRTPEPPTPKRHGFASRLIAIQFSASANNFMFTPKLPDRIWAHFGSHAKGAGDISSG